MGLEFPQHPQFPKAILWILQNSSACKPRSRVATVKGLRPARSPLTAPRWLRACLRSPQAKTVAPGSNAVQTPRRQPRRGLKPTPNSLLCPAHHQPPGRGGAVLLSDLLWTPTQGALARQGLWPGRPSSRPPAPAGDHLATAPVTTPPPPTPALPRHTARGTWRDPRSPGQPCKRLQLCPSSGATQQPQAVWVPTHAHQPGHGWGPGSVGPAHPGSPGRTALLTATPQQLLLQASGCRLRFTKRFQRVGTQS